MEIAGHCRSLSRVFLENTQAQDVNELDMFIFECARFRRIWGTVYGALSYYVGSMPPALPWHSASSPAPRE